MSTTQQSIFSSYEKDPKFYDEIFDEKGNSIKNKKGELV